MAMAWPMPELEPVTRITFEEKSLLVAAIAVDVCVGVDVSTLGQRPN